MAELNNNPLDLSNRTWTLAAGEQIEIAGNNASGFTVLSATANFEISLDQQSFCEVFAGFKYNAPEGGAITSIRIRNSSGAANTIGFMWGKGDFTDARLALIGAITVTNVAFGQAAGVGGTTTPELVCPAGARTLLLSFASNRQVAILRSIHKNLGSVRIAGSGVTATNGLALDAGDELRLPWQSAIHAWNPNPYPVTISVHSVNNS